MLLYCKFNTNAMFKNKTSLIILIVVSFLLLVSLAGNTINFLQLRNITQEQEIIKNDITKLKNDTKEALNKSDEYDDWGIKNDIDDLESRIDDIENNIDDLNRYSHYHY